MRAHLSRPLCLALSRTLPAYGLGPRPFAADLRPRMLAAQAVEPDEVLQDPGLEARAGAFYWRALAHERLARAAYDAILCVSGLTAIPTSTSPGSQSRPARRRIPITPRALSRSRTAAAQRRATVLAGGRTQLWANSRGADSRSAEEGQRARNWVRYRGASHLLRQGAAQRLSGGPVIPT
jgi:hypothetical protein